METAQAASAGASWTKRIALAVAMAFLAMNVWIGGPLLALWIGSRLQTASGGSVKIKPATALAVFASLAVITVVLVKALGTVAAASERASGVEPPKGRRRGSWGSGAGESYWRPPPSRA